MVIVALDGYAANPGDISWDGFKEIGNLKVYDRSGSNDEIVDRAKDADAILINKVQVTDELLSRLPRLKYIGEFATGFNNIDLEAAKNHGITVTNIPAYSTDSVAQMVFAHLLNVALRVDHYAALNRNGRWSACPDFCYWDTPLVELTGKYIGIYGLGHIGSKVACIAHDFGMVVLAHTSKQQSELPNYIKKVSFEEMMSLADVVTLHCPLTPDTNHLINTKAIALMKHDAILINTGRGPLVDEKAVADALKQHRIKAYCADVMTEEPPKADNPLFKCDNAYITPHIAWASLEARKRLFKIAEQNLQAFIDGNPINIVNK